MSEHDELDALRAAWRRLEAPPAASLSDAPPRERETQACVDWMARAWRTLDQGAPREPSAPAVRSLRRTILLRTLPFAAAASALLVLKPPTPRVPPPTTSLARAEPIRPVILADGSVETRHGNVRLILVPDPEPSARATNDR